MLRLSSSEEGSAIVSFDREGALMIELFFERTKATRWLFVRSIPIHVTLLKTLRCINACVSFCPRTSCNNVDDSPFRGVRGGNCEGCVNVVRVGYVLKESRAYCVLMQFTSPEGAEHVKRQLLEINLMGSVPTLSEYVHPWAKTMTRTQSDVHGSEAVSGQQYVTDPDEISLELLCIVMHGGGMLSEISLQSDRSFGDSTWRAVEERQDRDNVTLKASLVPTENFCTICQEDNFSCGSFFVTLCNHVFHLSCFFKHLEDVGLFCPLCRFSMASLESRCGICGTCRDLWTCLVCGLVACGQGYCSDHVKHFMATGHSCTMQNSTCRIWNHRTKMFLHQQLAIELGRADDVKAAQAAAEEKASAGGHVKGDNSDVTASSYWRSRWWWDEKDDGEAPNLSNEIVHKYYMGVLQGLMKEQFDFYEQSLREKEKMGAALVATCAGTSRSFLAAVNRLVAKEQQQRRRIVEEYVLCMQQIALEDEMLFKRFVRHEARRNENLRDDLLLRSHTVQSLQSQVKKTKSLITAARLQGERQTACRREKLKILEEELGALMRKM